MAKGRLPSVVARGKSIARKRFRRDFGERLLKGFGFGEGDFRSGGFVKGKLGLFGESITKSIPGQAGPGPAPVMETPEKVANENNPTFATIVEQLDKLVKTANKVGVITKEQQDAMLGQMAQARRIAKEQILENKPAAAIPEPVSAGAGDSITPLGDAVEDLTEKLNKLTGIVQDKVDENDSNNRGFMERMADNYGFGDDYRTRRRRRQARAARLANITRGARPSSFTVGGVEYRQNRAGRWYGPGGRFASRDVANTLSRRQAAATASAARAARLSTSGGLSDRLGRIISLGMRRPGTTGGNIKSAVRRLAGPLIAKSLGATALKSIPIVGAVAGVGFAINRLVQGDPVGAGLDLMSGLAGPLTAIPALVASIARDVYSGVYGVQPERDPEFGSRITGVTSAVQDLVKEELGQTVKPKQAPTQDQVDRATIPSPAPTPQRVSAPALPSAPAAPAPAPAPSTSGGGGGGNVTPGDVSGGSGKVSAAPAAADGDMERQDAPTIQAQIVPGETKSGLEIIQATMDPPPVQIPSMYGYNQEQGRFLPQTSSKTQNGHVGIGNVPNPDYIPDAPNNLGDLYRVMFFNVNYQEQ